MRCRTVIGRHVLLSTSSGHFNSLRFFGHRSYFYVDTCCVWGGFGRFQTYLGATTRCLLFAGTGGVFTQWGKPPPVFALFCFICFVFLSRSPTVVSDQGIVHNCFLGAPRLRGTFPRVPAAVQGDNVPIVVSRSTRGYCHT